MTISLCMIVKNEENVLARCLDSFRELVDEIVIVDTGSTDSTEGVLGAVAYLGIFIAVFRRACRAVAKEPVLIPFMAAIVAYIGHNVFCYQQCECTTTIFIMLGMAEMICRSVEKSGRTGGT